LYQSVSQTIEPDWVWAAAHRNNTAQTSATAAYRTAPEDHLARQRVPLLPVRILFILVFILKQLYRISQGAGENADRNGNGFYA